MTDQALYEMAQDHIEAQDSNQVWFEHAVGKIDIKEVFQKMETYDPSEAGVICGEYLGMAEHFNWKELRQEGEVWKLVIKAKLLDEEDIDVISELSGGSYRITASKDGWMYCSMLVY